MKAPEHVLIPWEDIAAAFFGRIEKIAPYAAVEPHKVTYRPLPKGLSIEVVPCQAKDVKE